MTINNEQKYLALIPARAGSKRIKGKNVKDFRGHPIIAWSIHAAKQSGLFKSVIVSTDCEEIANIALQYGASVPFLRSPENSDDHATIAQVIAETYSKFLALGTSFDSICCIYATSPFTTPAQLKEGITLMNQARLDSVFPVTHFEYPIQRALSRDKKRKISFLEPSHANTRSQDLPQRFHDAGMWLWLKPKILENELTLFTHNTGSVYIQPDACQDIDTEMDWKIALIKHELKFPGSNQPNRIMQAKFTEVAK